MRRREQWREEEGRVWLEKGPCREGASSGSIRAWPDARRGGARERARAARRGFDGRGAWRGQRMDTEDGFGAGRDWQASSPFRGRRDRSSRRLLAFLISGGRRGDFPALRRSTLGCVLAPGKQSSCGFKNENALNRWRFVWLGLRSWQRIRSHTMGECGSANDVDVLYGSHAV